MNYKFVNEGNNHYVECLPNGMKILSEQDALGLVAACGEHETGRLLLYGENLIEDFFNLKTGLAGSVLQKFANYHLRVALVLSTDFELQGRFGEMVLEANRGRQFHVCTDRAEAERWLIEA